MSVLRKARVRNTVFCLWEMPTDYTGSYDRVAWHVEDPKDSTYDLGSIDTGLSEFTPNEDAVPVPRETLADIVEFMRQGGAGE